MKLDQVPVTQIETRFLALSGDARLEATAMDCSPPARSRPTRAGSARSPQPLPSVSEDVVVVRATTPRRPQEPKKDPIRLDVTLGLGDHLYFQGRGLDTRLAGEIKITGTPGPGLRATAASSAPSAAPSTATARSSRSSAAC